VRVILATRSRGKLDELHGVLTPLGYELVALDDAGIEFRDEEEDVERYDTFEENAQAKARYYSKRAGGAAVIADDSGLEVAALGGLPGVRSKRWAGRRDLEGRALDAANNAKLVGALAGVTDRAARFVSVVVFREGAGAGAREIVARGEVPGEILLDGRGDRGFGYDPYFYSPELGRTLAEASREEKSRVSHRGRALGALVARLAAAGH
jgi:XTP/dITP diphosphohydrolase